MWRKRQKKKQNLKTDLNQAILSRKNENDNKMIYDEIERTRLPKDDARRTDINEKNSDDGYTALHTAVALGYLDIVKRLIEAKAKVNLFCDQGYTPINLAAMEGYIKIVEYLVYKSAKVNLAKKECFSPINSASWEGHFDIVKLLQESNANIDSPDLDGFTPLMSAAAMGHIKIVRFLIQKGADINKKSKQGWTPLLFALWQHKADVVDFLLYQKKIKVTGKIGQLSRNCDQSIKFKELALRICEPPEYEDKRRALGDPEKSRIETRRNFNTCVKYDSEPVLYYIIDQEFMTPLLMAKKAGNEDWIKLIESRINNSPCSGCQPRAYPNFGSRHNPSPRFY